LKSRFPALFLCLSLAPASTIPAPPLARRIERILNASPAARQAFWGIQAADASSGRVFYELNAGRLFAPASNTKLFTAALALERLGPDYRFRTRVVADGMPDEAGRLKGELRLAGGGDPTLGADAGLDTLADQVLARGVRRIEGDLVGDDTAYAWEPYPQGWEQDDTLPDYGAPVSALTLNNNTITVRVRAGHVFVWPPIEYYALDNRVRAAPGLENAVWLERVLGSRQVRLWGSMSSDPAAEIRRTIAVDDPALYAALAFRDALERRGVAVAGRPVARHRFLNESPAPAAAGLQLGERQSAPLIELLRTMQKNSVNLYAELALREVARARRGAGSMKGALDERRQFLTELGIAQTDFRLTDGSGLSDLNLVSPAAVVKVLRHMYASKEGPAWVALLPVGAQDGTLAERFRGTAGARRIHAKTGTLSHASALSGYVEGRRGTVAFSILVNNYNCPAEEIRAVIDRVALALAPTGSAGR
jgi:serine-type D-Ala-D-Ala carboxypeptidase/endopeptidase (penicillin-binding protein 4)